MGCGSSSLNPMAGRNAVTQAASVRKKAAKEVLVTESKFGEAYVAYFEAMKNVGSSLGAFLEDEDRALSRSYQGQPNPQQLLLEYHHSQELQKQQLATSAAPPPTHAKAEPPNPILEQQQDKQPPTPPPGMAEEPQPLGMPKSSAADGEAAQKPAGWSADGHTFKYAESANAAYDVVKSGKSNVAGDASEYPEPPDELPPQLPLEGRGAGLGHLWRALNGMFVEVVQAVQPAVDQLRPGLPREYSQPPPLPPLQGQPLAMKLEEALAMLVAYEQYRNKETKFMEQAKWDHGRHSKRLKSAAQKQVTVEKAAKQQTRINTVHETVQALQSKINMHAENVTNATHSIEVIKNLMIRPLLMQLLPHLANSYMQVASIHDRQRQFVLQTVGHEEYISKIVGGAGVLYTTKAHMQETHTLELALAKWDQALSNLLITQRSFFTSILQWLKTCNPSGAVHIPGPTNAAPLALPIAGARGPQDPPEAKVKRAPEPADGPGAGAIVPVKPVTSIVPAAPPPPNVLAGQFLGVDIAVGEPLQSLCQNWLKAMDKLPDLQVKDAVLAYLNNIKEVEKKQQAEMHQLKVVQEAKKNAEKAKHKFEALLRKEQETRKKLHSPYEGPMSSTLQSRVSHTPLGEPPPLAIMGPPPSAEGQHAEDGTPVAANNRQLQAYESANSFGTPHSQTPLNKQMAKQQKHEDSLQVKAFGIAKEVDIAKGLWEGAKVKVLEEVGSLQVCAYEGHKMAIGGVQQHLPEVFAGVAGFSVILSQMYLMLQYQHPQQNYIQ